MQISMFDGENKYVIDKPIRLIELFAGYGSQHLALKYLGVKVESWRICEWAVKSIQAYKDLHFGNDNTDYCYNLTTDGSSPKHNNKVRLLGRCSKRRRRL